MRLLVMELKFKGNCRAYAEQLIRVPRMREIFTEGYEYRGRMDPKKVEGHRYFWWADSVLDALPEPEPNTLSIVYVSKNLIDIVAGRIGGRRRGNRCLVTNYNDVTSEYMRPDDTDLISTAMEELGHALGVDTHHMNPEIPCAMQGKLRNTPDFESVEDVGYCDGCWESIQSTLSSS
ncbi:MAG: hypothetical protein HY512_02380 [Candidatus Aenigmarchaeota archaeon]|nr:hypothetical protein [Candidatus Aenigmarchaeota archaeon]